MNERNSMYDNEFYDDENTVEPVKEDKVKEEPEALAQEEKATFEKIDDSKEPIQISHEEAVVKKVPVGKKMNFKTVFVSLLVVMLVSTSTYTIGYYRGQIGIEDEALMRRIDSLIGDVKGNEVKESVYAIMQDNPEAFDTNLMGFSTVYEGIKSSVVSITSKSTYYDWFNVERTRGGTGSGVIVGETKDLYYIVTNNHVVEGASEVVIEVADGMAIDAKLIGADKQTDVAVVSIAKKDIDSDVQKTLKPMEIGDSDKVKVGEPAIAIGSPLGYNNTLTAGFVSAKDRSIQSDRTGVYIQTDAAINPGNSGGALVNSSGQLIGINTAKIADSTVEGMGFAIPINTVMPIVEELIKTGSVARPYIGIVGKEISTQESSMYEIPMGVMLVEVLENSPAEKAGLQRTDLIIGIDDVKVFKMSDISGYITNKKPGDKVKITFIREGKDKMTSEVIIGNSASK